MAKKWLQGPPTNKDDRTNAVGLYHYARSYRAAAEALSKQSLESTHPDAPVEFLFLHAIELYLKSYLRLAGLSVSQIVSHNLPDLARRFELFGGFLMDEDKAVLASVSWGNFIEVRYIRTGFFSKAPIEALRRTATSLHETVRQEIRGAGLLCAQ